MKRATSEKEIEEHVEGKGSLNCALTAFRQGKPVYLATPDSDIKELIKELKNEK